MLETYKEKYHKNKFQYILIDDLGNIIESDDTLLKVKIGRQIQDLHPLFESISELFKPEDGTYDFSCVNLNFESFTIVADILILNQNNSTSIISIEDLTNHYDSYQRTAQGRNESIINYQILELKNEYLLEKEAFKNNFIANFSHELRNPITASSVFSKFLGNTDLSSEQKNYLDIIISANNDLQQRIEDILDTASIESGKLIFRELPFDLSKLLKEIESFFNILATKKNLSFSCNIDENLPEFVVGDAYQLKQIIGSLLKNALTFTDKGSIVLNVSLNYLRAGKASIQFKISDTGTGIDKKDQDAIFERFNKVNDVASNNKNIGLGLYIVKKLVTQMSGNISVESALEKGSTFTCNLSFKVSKLKTLNETLKQNEQRPVFDTKKNVLLIEDSELIQLSILKILSADGNFYINILSNAEDLLPAIIDQDIDIILVSNTIQRYTAEQIANKIHSTSKELKKIPVLALTTEVFKEDLKRYKKAGIKDVVTKPFDSKSLLDKLYKYIKK